MGTSLHVRRAVIYCRISQDIEGTGLGVQRQEQECRELCERYGWEVVAVFSDNDISAYSGKLRPDYEQLKQVLREGRADVLVAWAPDRITRHPIELEDLIELLERQKVEVRTVTSGDLDLSTPGGRLNARLLGNVARHESEQKAVRTRAAYRQMAAHGRPAGGPPPYGYLRVDKAYVVHPERAAHVRWMAGQVLAGKTPYEVAKELNQRGVLSAEGKVWRSEAVRRAVTRAAVAGLREYAPRSAGQKKVPGKIIGDADWEPILDRSTWAAARAVLLDPARPRNAKPLSYPLTNLLYSKADDQPMWGAVDAYGRDGAKRRCYVGRRASIDAQKVEVIVFGVALNLLEADDWSEIEAFEPSDDLVKVNGLLEELATLAGNQEISMGEWLAARKPLEAQKEKLEAATPKVVKARLDVQPADLRRKWAEEDERGEMNVNERRRVVAAVLPKIVVGPATRARWTTVEERLEFLDLRSRAGSA